MAARLPVLFLGHGSPMTSISDVPERRAWQLLAERLKRPKAILCISAHWETHGQSHLTAQTLPPTIHDFSGFPPELFAVRYPAPGSPELVSRVIALLGPDRATADHTWGFDHGSWGVAMPMFPDADMPMVQLSLDRSLAPEQHLELGAKLAPLRDEGVLIVASGNIIHNIPLWFKLQGQRVEWAIEFHDRINAAVAANDHTALTRFAADDQAAALAINSGEHYLPLLYAVGARLPGDEAGFFNDAVNGAGSMTSIVIGDATLAAALN